MIFKLCYLFTFITSTLNILNVTNIDWDVVFAPSIIALGINAILLIIALVLYGVGIWFGSR